MLVSTAVNLIFIPSLYVMVQRLRGEAKRSGSEEEEAPAPAASH
jgi:HAE1 family hydrophobic/amphiphilic exporter-1